MDKHTLLKQVLVELIQQLSIISGEQDGERADWFDDEIGLCSNAIGCGESIEEDYPIGMSRLFSSTFQSWEHFSGVDEYPIPYSRLKGLCGVRDPKTVYNHVTHKYKGEQLELRISLLEHAYDTLFGDDESNFK